MPAFVAPGGEVDFNKYSIVIAFGDSTITQFAQRNLIWPGGNIGAPLTTARFITHEKQQKGVISPSIITQIINQVHNAHTDYENNIDFVMGSVVWDILADSRGQGTDFGDHASTYTATIDCLLPFAPSKFPTLNLYWKSVTVMHIHQVQQLHIEPVVYMSYSQARDLYLF
eukprot:CAMPEP_0202486318 /NCGR_PEP_ID=MMETSP1361-20130828/4917_1 /ASSEMBLY_ACC=CAM_ASM_000849 /TAXON_ID=210615 /ORGANISM="Staurosira complex sp., Strain CCMP2646" /LENGTH=169 /DNA_ID=CAMNT_0049115415 /DNA_START=564 /DNA_END=1073 /DNA_ORIENTATION=-